VKPPPPIPWSPWRDLIPAAVIWVVVAIVLVIIVLA
jgi:hypothetical protein